MQFNRHSTWSIRDQYFEHDQNFERRTRSLPIYAECPGSSPSRICRLEYETRIGEVQDKILESMKAPLG